MIKIQFIFPILIALFLGCFISANPLKPGYSYPVPVLKKGAHILFIGDSITDMQRSRNPYGWDQNHLLGHSYVFLISGRLGIDAVDFNYTFSNRGISGNTVADLKKRWQKDAIDPKPDLLSILIGTNDVGRGVTPQAYERDYRTILSKSRKENPKLKLVLLDPFVLRSSKLGDQKIWQNRKTATDQMGMVVARLAKEFKAVHVPMQDIFDEAISVAPAVHWIWDGIHPLPAGHEIIARSWLDAVSGRWPGK
jgi:lysophospholipase L1-like esterase